MTKSKKKNIVIFIAVIIFILFLAFVIYLISLLLYFQESAQCSYAYHDGARGAYEIVATAVRINNFTGNATVTETHGTIGDMTGHGIVDVVVDVVSSGNDIIITSTHTHPSRGTTHIHPDPYLSSCTRCFNRK